MARIMKPLWPKAGGPPTDLPTGQPRRPGRLRRHNVLNWIQERFVKIDELTFQPLHTQCDIVGLLQNTSLRPYGASRNNLHDYAHLDQTTPHGYSQWVQLLMMSHTGSRLLNVLGELAGAMAWHSTYPNIPALIALRSIIKVRKPLMIVTFGAVAKDNCEKFGWPNTRLICAPHPTKQWECATLAYSINSRLALLRSKREKAKL